MRTTAWVVVALLAGPALAAATGRVVATDGKPVGGAQLCEFVEGSPEHCVITDAQGVYRMDAPSRPSLLVRAKGFIAKTVEAVPLGEPVALERAAILLVTVVDAETRKPLASGRVRIDSPSGRRIGTFVPFNRSGVRISTMEPGDVLVRAEADGYAPGGPLPVQLVSGKERSVTVPMKKQARKAP